MKTQKIKKQINMVKIHKARTTTAKKRLTKSDEIRARYGGIYTQTEINLLYDLHPYLRDETNDAVQPETLSEGEIFAMLERLGMYARYTQEDNYFMV